MTCLEGPATTESFFLHFARRRKRPQAGRGPKAVTRRNPLPPAAVPAVVAGWAEGAKVRKDVVAALPPRLYVVNVQTSATPTVRGGAACSIWPARALIPIPLQSCAAQSLPFGCAVIWILHSCALGRGWLPAWRVVLGRSLRHAFHPDSKKPARASPAGRWHSKGFRYACMI